VIRKLSLLGAAALGIVASAVGVVPLTQTQAASHREAPLISLDPSADISDFFMFRSYEPGKDDKLVLVMNVNPGSDPSSGPNYWNFDPNVRYAFNIDTNMDGRAGDVVLEFQFRNEIRGVVDQLDLPLSYVALPPITALDGPGSEGLGLRQRYSVTLSRRGERRQITNSLIAVPSNVGPRTMPDYEALAQQGIYDIGSGIRVFAGQRQDPFYIDLGGIFDTLNLRRDLPLLTAAEDADDTFNPFGDDHLAGFSVSTIAVEIPISLITQDGKGPEETSTPKIGGYASTSRRQTTVLRHEGGTRVSGNWVQVQRLANPLVNELIIGTSDKDLWNALEPRRERRFEEYYLNPRLALALETVYGVPAAKTDRSDLRDLLLTYGSPSQQTNRDSVLSELLRLDLSVDPVPLADQKRLTILAHDETGAATPDGAGWPNGRRPKDDVTDIAIRVIGGENYIVNFAGDGVNVDDAELGESFPFLATPFDGRDRN